LYNQPPAPPLATIVKVYALATEKQVYLPETSLPLIEPEPVVNSPHN